MLLVCSQCPKCCPYKAQPLLQSVIVGKNMKWGMKGKGGRQIKCENKARHTSGLSVSAVPFALSDSETIAEYFWLYERITVSRYAVRNSEPHLKKLLSKGIITVLEWQNFHSYWSISIILVSGFFGFSILSLPTPQTSFHGYDLVAYWMISLLSMHLVNIT